MKTTTRMLRAILIFVFLLEGSQTLLAQTNTSATQTVCVGSTGEPYLIPTPTTGSIFNWTISSGGTIASGNGTNQIAVDWGNNPGGPHTITVTETDAFGCIGADVTVVVTLTDAATASAGSPDNVCAGNAYSVISATATNYSVISWTSTGTGTFSGGTTLTPTYTPSAADIAAGNVMLTLTALGNSPCSDATSTMVLTIIPAPTADASIDDNICEGSTYTLSGTSATNNASVNWATTGTGTFSGGTTLTPTYTPSTADIAAGNVTLTLTALGNSPCSDATSTMVLTIIPAPTVDAGPDDAICGGIPYVFVSGPTTTNSTVVLWSTSGDGTFTGSTTLIPIYTPGTVDIANGTVNLTITATGTAPCTTVANTMTLTINPTPITGAINHW